MSDNGPRKTCMCGVPVHEALELVMWIQVVFLGLSFIISIFTLYGIIGSILGLFLVWLLLHGKKHGRPDNYLPYLALTTTGYAINIGLAGYHLYGMTENMEWNLRTTFTFIGITFAIFIIGAFLVYLFLVIPYLSYNLLKYEVANGQFASPTNEEPEHVVVKGREQKPDSVLALYTDKV